MSIYTTHYNLDKYESTDRPNLRDQYNSAMDKIDGLLYQQAGAVSGATQAVSTLQQQVSTNTGNITGLQQGLATTDAKATTAASDAAAAVLQLGGAKIHKLGPTEMGTKWTAASGYSHLGFSAIIVEFPDDEVDSLLIGHVYARVSGTYGPSDPNWNDHTILTLSDWIRSSTATEALLVSVGGDVPAAFTSARPMIGMTSGGAIYWTHGDQIASSVSNFIMQADFIFPVSPRQS